MPNLIFRYYLTDWAATILTLYGVYILGEKKRNGFIILFVSNIIWFGFGLLTHSLATLLVNVVVALLNVRGYFKWKT